MSWGRGRKNYCENCLHGKIHACGRGWNRSLWGLAGHIQGFDPHCLRGARDPGLGVRGVGHGQRCQGKGNASSARGAPHLAGCWWALGAPHALCHPGRRDRSLRDQPKEPQQVTAAHGHCHIHPKGTMCLSPLGRAVIQTWPVSFNFKRVTKSNEKLWFCHSTQEYGRILCTGIIVMLWCNTRCSQNRKPGSY